MAAMVNLLPDTICAWGGGLIFLKVIISNVVVVEWGDNNMHIDWSSLGLGKYTKNPWYTHTHCVCEREGEREREK